MAKTKTTAKDIDAAIYRASFREFAEAAWPIVEPSMAFVPGMHVDAICLHLQAVTEGKIRKLLINIPPGHAKSLLVSVLWPAWIWARNAGWRALFGSYADALATRDAVRCRTLMESDWYRDHFKPTWTFAVDQNRKDFYQNSALGARVSLSVGGKATGFRGDAVVIDDPHNAMDAKSKAKRSEAVSWFNTALPSRLNDMRKGAYVVIMQRLHEEDLSGDIMARGDPDWVYLCLPSHYDPARKCKTPIWEDPRTEKGQLLFPELFPETVLESLKTQLGADYAGQYEQTPVGEGDELFKPDHWRYWKPDGTAAGTMPRPEGAWTGPAVALPDKFDQVIASWDLAFKGKEDSDYVCGIVLARKGASFYVLDRRHKRWTFSDTLREMQALHYRWPEARKILVEDKANGPAIIDALKAEIVGIIAVNPEGGKESRASACQPSVEAGQVYLPDGAPWLASWFAEFRGFPRAAHDDQVDALSQGVIYMLPQRTSFAERFKQGIASGKIGVPMRRAFGLIT